MIEQKEAAQIIEEVRTAVKDWRKVSSELQIPQKYSLLIVVNGIICKRLKSLARHKMGRRKYPREGRR